MASRVGLLGILALVVVSCLAGSARSQPPIGTSVYVVRVDPRLCPSPLCGGYWVALANHARSRCSDGKLRQRCYIAKAVDEGRHPLEVTVPDGALVRADIDSQEFQGLGELGVLAVATVYEQAGKAPATGRYFRVVDTGIRCIRAPCFSMRAAQLNRAYTTTSSGLVLSTLGAREDLEERVLAALATKNGVFARGRIVATPDGGRVFHASRFYLRSQG
jgi:hypothetical protein